MTTSLTPIALAAVALAAECHDAAAAMSRFQCNLTIATIHEDDPATQDVCRTASDST